MCTRLCVCVQQFGAAAHTHVVDVFALSLHNWRRRRCDQRIFNRRRVSGFCSLACSCAVHKITVDTVLLLLLLLLLLFCRPQAAERGKKRVGDLPSRSRFFFFFLLVNGRDDDDEKIPYDVEANERARASFLRPVRERVLLRELTSEPPAHTHTHTSWRSSAYEC